MKPIIVFIDDSKFEHDMVREEVAPCAPDYEFVHTTTFEEAMKVLGKRVPALFLLDLWGQDEAVQEPFITSKKELEKKIAGFPNLDQVYKDLDSFEGDVHNEYLKRLFSIVDSWRSLFETVCDRIGQNRKYGLSNLRQVRAHYPDVPAVFYTRKSLINDAVAMLNAGADGLYIKPTGYNDSETRHLTRTFAPRLMDALKGIIESKQKTG